MQYKPSPAGKGDHAVVDEEIEYGKTIFYSSVNFVDTFPAKEGLMVVVIFVIHMAPNFCKEKASELSHWSVTLGF